jgi:hypothetical protein
MKIPHQTHMSLATSHNTGDSSSLRTGHFFERRVRTVFRLYAVPALGSDSDLALLLTPWRYYLAFTAFMGTPPTTDEMEGRFDQGVMETLDPCESATAYTGSGVGFSQFREEMLVRYGHKYGAEATVELSPPKVTSVSPRRPASSILSSAEKHCWDLFTVLDQNNGCIVVKDLEQVHSNLSKGIEILESKTGNPSSEQGASSTPARGPFCAVDLAHKDEGESSEIDRAAKATIEQARSIQSALDSYPSRLQVFHQVDPLQKGRVAFSDFQTRYFAHLTAAH